MKIVFVLFLSIMLAGCETTASKSTVKTDSEGKTSSEVVEHKVKTDLPVEKITQQMIDAAKEREEQKEVAE